MNIYHTTATISYEAYKTMCWALMRRRKALIVIGILLLLLIASGIAFWAMGARGIGLFVLMMGAVYPLLIYLAARANIRRAYRTTKISQNLTLDYTFEPERMMVKSANGESQVRYEALYKVIETPTHFYLMIGSNQAYIVVKAQCEPALIAFLQKLSADIRQKPAGGIQ